jgi:hypothetical protein
MQRLVSTSTLLVLGMTSASLAQEEQPAPPLAQSPELTQPISTRAADLLPTPISTIAVPPLEEASSAAGFAQADNRSENQPEEPADSAEPVESRDPEQGVRVLPSLNEGAAIERIFIHLRNPTGDPAKDGGYKQQIAETFQIRAGSNFSSLFADLALRQVQQLPFVTTAEYRLYEAATPGRVILAVLVRLQPETTGQPEPAKKSRGIFVNGDFSQFPILYESDRALVKTILNAGFGVFSDTNA